MIPSNSSRPGCRVKRRGQRIDIETFDRDGRRRDVAAGAKGLAPGFEHETRLDRAFFRRVEDVVERDEADGAEVDLELRRARQLAAADARPRRLCLQIETGCARRQPLDRQVERPKAESRAELDLERPAEGRTAGFEQQYVLVTKHVHNTATYCCPVFIASNKEIGMTRESVDLEALEKPALVDRAAPPDRAHFQPFQISNGQTVPYFLPIGDSVPVRQTSSTHGADGYITTDAEEIKSFQRRLQDKLQSSVEHYSYHELIAENARTLLITYGVTSRAAAAACRLAKQQGNPVSLLVLKTLWPVPEALIRRSARQAERVVVIEMNLGQYVNEIRRVLPDKPIDFFGQMDGRLITPRQIEEVIARG